MPISSRRLWAPLAAGLPVLLLTLAPGASAYEQTSPLCILCGSEGLSDVLRNVPLFVPLGFALGFAGLDVRRALLIGLALSVGIELTQFVVPNRFPGLGDLISNAGGAGLGAMLYGARERLLHPRPGAGAVLGASWAALGLASIVATPRLLSPDLPPVPWTVGWTPEARGVDRYGGRVLEAVVDGAELSPGPAGAGVETALAAGARLELRFVAGPRPERLAPILALFDPSEREVLLVGLDDRDLVVRFRTRAAGLRLDGPDLRVRGVSSALSPGDTVGVRLDALGHGVRIGLAGPIVVPDRAVRVPAARGWGFLMAPARLAGPAAGAVDALWMLLWTLPLAYWTRGQALAGAVAVWAAGLVVLPFPNPFVGPSVAGLVGIVIGLVLGGWSRPGSPILRSGLDSRASGQPG